MIFNTEEKVDLFLGHVLRIGVLLSFFVVIVGAALFLSRHGEETPNYHIFHGESAELKGIKGVLTEISQGKSRGIIQLGILILVLTPAIRVGFCALIFLIQRDFLYVLIALIVLSALLYSLSWEPLMS